MTIAETNFQEFLAELEAGELVFTIVDADGAVPCPKGSGEASVMPFWSSRERVEKVIRTVPDYAGFSPKSIPLGEFLDTWLPGLARDGLDVGINWAGRKALGYDMSPVDLKQELENPVQDDDEVVESDDETPGGA